MAIIGLGYWGPNYARVCTELPGIELVAACDTSEEAAAIIKSRYPSVRTTRDPGNVIGADDVDAVIVSTPTSTHYALSRAVLEAGKHVLCEKPLASTVAECDELIEAAERAGSVLFVGHTFIFNPAVRRMREFVASGDIGRVLYCHAARTGLGPIREDVNVLWDLAPHDLSILFYLMDQEPTDVWATGQSFLREGREDVAFLHFGFEDGAIAAAHLSWLDPYKVRRVTVVGDERMVVFDDVAPDEKLKVFDRGASYESVSESVRGAGYGEFTTLIRDGDIHIPKVSSREPLKDQVAHFVACCLTGSRPETDGHAGRRVVAALESATRALRSNSISQPMSLPANRP